MLSEQERRVLQEIERGITAEAPRLAAAMKSAVPNRIHGSASPLWNAQDIRCCSDPASNCSVVALSSTS
jgi:hypothetical protein